MQSDGELGRAAAELLSARQDAFQHERMAANKDYSRAIRRIGRRAAPADIERVQVAEDRLEKLFRPEEQKLTEALDRATQKVGEISHEVSDRERWMDDHPTRLATWPSWVRSSGRSSTRTTTSAGPSKES